MSVTEAPELAGLEGDTASRTPAQSALSDLETPSTLALSAQPANTKAHSKHAACRTIRSPSVRSNRVDMLPSPLLRDTKLSSIACWPPRCILRKADMQRNN